MWEEYELTLHAAMELRNEEYTDLAAMKKMIASIKDEIRKLGDVNVNAIEDYKEISERYGFLKTQHDDLVEAEKTLVGIIEELDTGMRKQFLEKFAEIQTEFDKVFKSCSAVEKERWNWSRTRIFWSAASALSRSHRERNCRI